MPPYWILALHRPALCSFSFFILELRLIQVWVQLLLGPHCLSYGILIIFFWVLLHVATITWHNNVTSDPNPNTNPHSQEMIPAPSARPPPPHFQINHPKALLWLYYSPPQKNLPCLPVALCIYHKLLPDTHHPQGIAFPLCSIFIFSYILAEHSASWISPCVSHLKHFPHLFLLASYLLSNAHLNFWILRSFHDILVWICPFPFLNSNNSVEIL